MSLAEATSSGWASIARTKLPPLSVHVVWSARSEAAGGLAPRVGEALFDLLGFKVAAKEIQPGAGIPVYLGTHFQLVDAWMKRCYEPDQAVRDASNAQRSLEDALTGANTRPCMVIVPVLDKESRGDPAFDRQIVAWMEFIEREQPHCNANLLLLPVPLTHGWLARIPTAVPPCRAAVWLNEDDAQLRAIEEEVGLEICHFLMDRDHWGHARPPRNRVRIFISHAKGDLKNTGYLAINLRNHLATTGLKSFFDLNDIARGRDLDSQLREGQENAIFLVIHSDSYAESPHCVEEFLIAKKYGVPMVLVSALKDGEARRPTYGGNTPVYVFDANAGDSFRRFAAMRCLVAWLRHLHFHHAARYAIAEHQYSVPPACISRPPELVDFAHGLLPMSRAGLVFYPDPPLPQSEALLLKKINPKLRLSTPTTAFEQDLARTPIPLLNGLRVGLSLSDSAEIPRLDGSKIATGAEAYGRSLGLVNAHYEELVSHLTMSLIRAGASLGYGGHLQKMGYTRLLSRLIGEHKRTTKSSRDLLDSYVARYIWGAADDKDTDDIDARYICCGDPMESVENGPPKDVRNSIQLSQMRTRMADECDVRIILGGKTDMGGAGLAEQGYSGAFPGQVEEAWQHLRLGKPVYVIGAFGGAGALLADVLSGRAPVALVGEQQQRFDGLIAGYQTQVQAGDLREALTYPDTHETMWADIRAAGRGVFFDRGPAGDAEPEHNTTWPDNGLTAAENETLFRSCNLIEIVDLIVKGMHQRFAYRRGNEAEAQRVRNLLLFNGSITDTPEVEAYAVTLMQGAPLKGADGAINERLDGALAVHLETTAPWASVDRELIEDPISFFSTPDADLAGDWVLLYKTRGIANPGSHGQGGDSSLAWREAFSQALGDAVKRILQRADAAGIASIAMVPFGANMGADLRTCIEVMVRAIKQAGPLTRLRTVVLCEHDPDRYDFVRQTLKAERAEAAADGVRALAITELTASPAARHHEKSEPIFLNIGRKDAHTVVCYAQTSDAGTAVSMRDAQVDWQQIVDLAHSNQGKPPDVTTHSDLGMRLAQLVLPESVAAVIRRHPERPIDIFHDPTTAALPFELFRFLDEDGRRFAPSNRGGMRRRLLADELFGNPRPYRRSFPLRILLVTNPTGDLPEADVEARILCELVDRLPDVTVTHLTSDTEDAQRKATKDNLLRELRAGYTVFHYAGHALFDTRDPARSGLRFPDDQRLTATDLQDARIEHNPPAVAVINACESGAIANRVEESAQATTVSFAEWFLKAGLNVYIGNIWKVGDTSAQQFAAQLYEDILHGERLSIGDAVLRARRMLARANNPDWCNYVLYGDADLRL